MYLHYTAALNIFKVNNRSNLSQMFLKIAIIKHFANFTGKDLYRSLFLIPLLFPLISSKNLRFSDDFSVNRKSATLLQRDSYTDVFR